MRVQLSRIAHMIIKNHVVVHSYRHIGGKFVLYHCLDCRKVWRR